MCFGGGGRSEPEKVSPVVTEEQKAKEAEEKKRTKQKRDQELEDTVAAQTPIATSMTYETGARTGQTVMRGKRSRSALYTSNRGGMGYRRTFG
tara:strand:- start:264 stop:542 length:279 start_codon:yes stop_codon:yes gene_type:complete